jgi:hypothetical protein
MARVSDVRLELVRPGPPHNQLLSPLTPYMALCGEGSPVTFHIELEHRQLLNRLERLRYVALDEHGNPGWIPGQLREAEVQELGEQMGRILSHITTLGPELARARPADDTTAAPFIHLRLVLSGSELAILPFELARAPQSYPGEGRDLFLQGSLPIVITREVRRSRPLVAAWGKRRPKILLVSAAPEGLTVPIREHVRALRDALDPWIGIYDDDATTTTDRRQRALKRVEAVKEHLRIITAASVEDIYDKCAAESFTHVHILAHGDVYSEAGEERFGIALHKKGTREKQVIGGRQLAKALKAEGRDAVSRSEPLVVSLAICDSGQQGSVLVPGGSIAHELHAEDIPWVFASQFPLTKPGSVHIAAFLYPRLLRGDDPRLILYELRRHLSMTAGGDHDWASMVAYASPEPELEHHAAEFFQHQTIRAIDVLMDRADRLVNRLSRYNFLRSPKVSKKVPQEVLSLLASGSQEEMRRNGATVETLLERARDHLTEWQRRLAPGQGLRERIARTNCYGMRGSTLKRMGLLYASIDEPDNAQLRLREALDAYRTGMDEWVTDDARFTWTASQYLALAAVLTDDGDAARGRTAYALCYRLAERDLDGNDRSNKGWAHGTLAELELIRRAYEAEARDTKRQVLSHCRRLVALMGRNSFHAQSTRRQMQRYAVGWHLGEEWTHPDWTKIAELAVKELEL